MIIKVLDRARARQLNPTEKCAIISITDTEQDIIKFAYNNNIKGVLRLHFLDEDNVGYYKHKVSSKFRIFGVSDAIKILDFMDSMKDVIDVLYIHCTAGVSRSPAVAAALCDIYNIDSDVNWFFMYTPNVFIYRKLLNTFHFRDELSVREGWVLGGQRPPAKAGS